MMRYVRMWPSVRRTRRDTAQAWSDLVACLRSDLKRLEGPEHPDHHDHEWKLMVERLSRQPFTRYLQCGCGTVMVAAASTPVGDVFQ
jgi:hypothetical protein